MGSFDIRGGLSARRTLGVALAVLLGAWGFAASPAALAQGRSVPVIVYETRLQPYSDRIEAIGTLRANESVALTANVADTITALNFEDGQRVEAGDVLVEMTSVEERALLNEALAQYNRARELAESGSIPQATLDARRRDYETTRARLQDRLVVAPFDGVVGLRTLSVGAYVSPGQVITTLNDDSVMKLDFSIPEVHLTAVQLGQPIEALARALPGESFEGEIEAIDTAIDPVTRSIRVRATLPNADHRLIPGMMMTVEILRGERMAIIIPEDAPITEGRETYVWVVQDDDTNVERRVIRLGSRQPGVVEVVDGLEVGERIVTRGGANLRPGNAIEILGTDSGGESLDGLLSQNDAS
jgi:membrane fusion protein (multidrug efflux system)